MLQHTCTHINTLNIRWRSQRLENSIREKLTSHRDHFLLQGQTRIHVCICTRAHAVKSPHIRRHTRAEAGPSQLHLRGRGGVRDTVTWRDETRQRNSHPRRNTRGENEVKYQFSMRCWYHVCSRSFPRFNSCHLTYKNGKSWVQTALFPRPCVYVCVDVSGSEIDFVCLVGSTKCSGSLSWPFWLSTRRPLICPRM